MITESDLMHKWSVSDCAIDRCHAIYSGLLSESALDLLSLDDDPDVQLALLDANDSDVRKLSDTQLVNLMTFSENRNIFERAQRIYHSLSEKRPFNRRTTRIYNTPTI